MGEFLVTFFLCPNLPIDVSICIGIWVRVCCRFVTKDDTMNLKPVFYCANIAKKSCLSLLAQRLVGRRVLALKIESTV